MCLDQELNLQPFGLWDSAGEKPPFTLFLRPSHSHWTPSSYWKETAEGEKHQVDGGIWTGHWLLTSIFQRHKEAYHCTVCCRWVYSPPGLSLFSPFHSCSHADCPVPHDSWGLSEIVNPMLQGACFRLLLEVGVSAFESQCRDKSQIDLLLNSLLGKFQVYIKIE